MVGEKGGRVEGFHQGQGGCGTRLLESIWFCNIWSIMSDKNLLVSRPSTNCHICCLCLRQRHWQVMLLSKIWDMIYHFLPLHDCFSIALYVEEYAGYIQLKKIQESNRRPNIMVDTEAQSYSWCFARTEWRIARSAGHFLKIFL